MIALVAFVDPMDTPTIREGHINGASFGDVASPEARDRDTKAKLTQIVIAERRAADERVRQSAEEYVARYRRDTALASAAAERQAADTAIRMFAELLGGA